MSSGWELVRLLGSVDPFRRRVTRTFDMPPAGGDIGRALPNHPADSSFLTRPRMETGLCRVSV